MQVRWPPQPLGLGTPLNLALLSPETRSRLARGWWRAPVVGLAAALEVKTHFWRIMTVNLIGSIVYGWFYWRRGFELAVLVHITVNTALYVGVPAFR